MASLIVFKLYVHLHLHFLVQTGAAFTPGLGQADWLKLSAKVSCLWIREYVVSKNCLMAGYGASYRVFLFHFFLLAFCYKMSWKLTRVTIKFFFKASLSEIWNNRPATYVSPSFFHLPSFLPVVKVKECLKRWFPPSLILKCCVVLWFTWNILLYSVKSFVERRNSDSSSSEERIQNFFLSYCDFLPARLLQTSNYWSSRISKDNL